MKVNILESTDNPEEVICEAARNDYSSEWVGDLTFEEVMSNIEGDDIDEKKETLIHHLLSKGHFGPFEHPHITFEVKGVSRSLMAQITRHRHVSFDIQSMRYVDFSGKRREDLAVTPPSTQNFDAGGRDPDRRSFDEIYEQSFVDEEPAGGYTKKEWLERERELEYMEAVEKSLESYNRLRELGMPPEDARMVLPIGSKVNMTFTLNARMLMHVADMRAAADAQWEVREMTEEVLSLAREWCPITFDYYEANMKNRKNRLAP